MIKKKNKQNRGVTLVELIVVVFIFTIISSITIFNYSNFRSSASIQNLADDIALSVRKAQGYAIGVRGYNSVFSGYGIHFTLKNRPETIYSGSNKSFILFANIQNLKTYNYSTLNPTCGNPSVENECLEILNIISNDSIVGIKIGLDNNDAIEATKEGTLDIFFNRPNPEPTFCYNDGVADIQDSCDYGSSISYISIKIMNEDGVYKEISVWNNGQISVD